MTSLGAENKVAVIEKARKYMKPGLLFMWPAKHYKDRTAIVFKDTRLTFSQMDARVNRLCNGLLSLGLSTEDKVGVLLENSVELVVSEFGINRAGLTFVALNTRHSLEENIAILKDSGVNALIAGQTFAEQIKPISIAVQSLRDIIVVGSMKGNWLDYDEFTEKQSEAWPAVEVDYDTDIQRIAYTSGSTGKPKGVIITFRVDYNIMTGTLVNMDLPIGPDDVNLSVGPLTHATGLMMKTYYIKGAKNVILPRFDEKAVLETIERERVTSVLLIPTMFYRLLMVPDLLSHDLSSLNRIWYGTAPMSVERLKEGIRIFGSIFRQNYAVTECPQPITYLGPEDHVVDGTDIQTQRLSSAGRPAIGIELRIVDSGGNDVPKGAVGEILVRSNKIMNGYWNMPEETAEAFKGGWLHTRDMGRIDDDGYLYIVDRTSEMIISGGFNIYPREVEEVLMAHPGVDEAAVIGVPDEEWGEAVKAIVVPKQGIELTESEIMEECKKHIATYKKPKSVEFVKHLPKNPNGKIDRRSLKARFWHGFDRFVH